MRRDEWVILAVAIVLAALMVVLLATDEPVRSALAVMYWPRGFRGLVRALARGTAETFGCRSSETDEIERRLTAAEDALDAHIRLDDARDEATAGRLDDALALLGEFYVPASGQLTVEPPSRKWEGTD